jgi:hypothetical protein
MKKKGIKYLIACCVSIPVIFIIGILGILTFRNQIAYIYADVILDNTSTDLFSCESFSSLEEVKAALESNNDSILDQAKQFSSWIETSEVGDRCPGKYQIEIDYQSHNQRVQLTKIIKDQKIRGIPVYLRNV